MTDAPLQARRAVHRRTDARQAYEARLRRRSNMIAAGSTSRWCWRW
jgi:hypothetical protein